MDKSQYEKLRTKAQSNKTLYDILDHVRKNDAYVTMSLRGLVNAFAAKGLRHSQPAIREALGIIAATGVGVAKKNDKGEVVNIVKMSVPTNELGAGVIGDSKNLKRFNDARKARGIEKVAEAVKSGTSEIKVFPYRQASSLSITLTINGKPVTMPLPGDLEPEELAALITRLRKAEDPR